jgi:hypothetical protein
MNDLMSMLNTLRRPRLMMRAARIGAEEYRRAVHLPRLLGDKCPARSGNALMQLMDMEAEFEMKRTTGDPGYRLAGHVDVLIAIIGEARVFQVSQAEAT